MSAITDGRARRAKHAGTGLLDTPIEAWAALFQDYMAGSEPLSHVVRRHGMRYSAAQEMERRGSWSYLRDMARGRRAGAVYAWQRYLAPRAHAWLAHGHTFLAEALASAPPPDENAIPPNVNPPDEFRRQPPAVDVRAAVVDLAAYRARAQEVRS